MREILVVDDERAVRASYRRLFEGEGYAVRLARSGAEALRLFDERRPDAVLLDVDMPEMNGYAVCRELRRRDSAVPVVFLTAMEGDADQLRGLGCGADDYVFKTAANAVLVARVAAALARRDAMLAAGGSRVIALGRVKFDADTFALTLDGETMDARLTMTEAALLRVLDAERGRSMSFKEIVTAMKGEGHVMEYSTFRTHLAALRRKLGPAGALIVNDRELGYRLLR